MKAQLETLVTIAPATANLARGEAAKRIVDLAPAGFSKVFFTNAGADANENAIRMARLYTGRDKVLSAYRSYHGNTGSAIAATGDWRRVPNEFSRGHVHFFNPYLYRSEFNAATEEEECQRALAHLRRIIECEGPTAIAAILLGSMAGGILADWHVLAALIVCALVYGGAVVANLWIPRLPAARPGQSWRFKPMTHSFFSACRTLWRNGETRFSLMGTSLFWGAGVTLRFLLVIWVPVALGITSNAMPTYLNAMVAVGIVLGLSLIHI